MGLESLCEMSVRHCARTYSAVEPQCRTEATIVSRSSETERPAQNLLGRIEPPSASALTDHGAKEDDGLETA